MTYNIIDIMNISKLTGETHMLKLPTKICLATSIGITLHTKVGDMIQEAASGKTAKVLYFDNFLGTNKRLLIVSPTEKPEVTASDEELEFFEVVLHGILLPDEVFTEVEDVTKVKLIAANLAIRYEADIPLAINMIIAQLAAQHYSSEVTRMQAEMDAKP